MRFVHGSRDAARQDTGAAARGSQRATPRGVQERFSARVALCFSRSRFCAFRSTPRFALACEEDAGKTPCGGSGGSRCGAVSTVEGEWIGKQAAGGGALGGGAKTEGQGFVCHVDESIPVEGHRDGLGLRGSGVDGGVDGASARGATHRIGGVRDPGRVAAAGERRGRCQSPRGLGARASEHPEAVHSAEVGELGGGGRDESRGGDARELCDLQRARRDARVI
ncbi:hypothetical protein T484DRAFT_1745100 [Baffinella frigidus]|nr:hypothetical protein T484DRAFT_1745100 [Cryptophyta sp. CCMP2293]